MEIRVSCYAGYRGEETPRRFWLAKQPVDITAVIDRWLSPSHRYFKVLGNDNAVYILRHDVLSLDWQLVFYQNKDAKSMYGRFGTIIKPTPMRKT